MITEHSWFAGEQRDSETVLIHLCARQCAPGLGRFVSRDAIGPNVARSNVVT